MGDDTLWQEVFKESEPLSWKNPIYVSEIRWDRFNTNYQREVLVDLSDGIETFKQIEAFDHVICKYKDNQRSKDNFIESWWLRADIDNDDDNVPSPADWMTVNQAKDKLKGIRCFFVTSRNHMKEKAKAEGKKIESARPRFHVYFPLRSAITNPEIFRGFERQLVNYFGKCADQQTMVDPARFFYASPDAEISSLEGREVRELLSQYTQTKEEPEPQETQEPPRKITLELLKEILSKVSVLNFATNDRWLPFITSCIAAAGESEEVRKALEDWSRGDPIYQSDPDVRTRINSLKEEGGIGVGTFIMLLREEGVPAELLDRLQLKVSEEDIQKLKEMFEAKQEPEEDWESKARTIESIRVDPNIKPRKWFIEDFCTPGNTITSGKKGNLKSYLALEKSYCLGAPDLYKFFNKKIPEAVKCLYIAFELDDISIKERAQKYGPLPPTVKIVFEWPNGDKALKQFEEAASRGYKYIAIDMFWSILPPTSDGKTPDYTLASTYMLKLRKIGQKYGCCFDCLMHSPKAKYEDFVDSVLGTVGFGAQADVVIFLDRKRGEYKGKLLTSGNHGPDTATNFAYNPDNRWLVLNEAEPTATFLPTELDKTLVALRSFGINGATCVEVGKKIGKTKETARAALNSIVTKGYAKIDPNRKGENGANIYVFQDKEPGV